MIAQFEANTFIKSARLNELVDGVNGNSAELEKFVILTANTTKTVGAGGDFETLGLALDWCKKVLPNGFKVILSLLPSYDINDNIVLSNIDFRFVEIISSDGLKRNCILTTGRFMEAYNSICPTLNIKIEGNNTISSLFLSFSEVILADYAELKNFNLAYISNKSKLLALGNNDLSSSNVAKGAVLSYNSDIKISSTSKLGSLLVSGGKAEVEYSTFIGTGVNVQVDKGGVASIFACTNDLYSQSINTVLPEGILFVV